MAVAGLDVRDVRVAAIGDHVLAQPEAVHGDVPLPPRQHRLALVFLHAGGWSPSVSRGSGLNHTSRRSGRGSSVRPGPARAYGATNSSPAAPGRRIARSPCTTGGCRSGRERKLWTSARSCRGGSASGVELIGSSLRDRELSRRVRGEPRRPQPRAHGHALAFGERPRAARSWRRRPASRRPGVPLWRAAARADHADRAQLAGGHAEEADLRPRRRRRGCRAAARPSPHQPAARSCRASPARTWGAACSGRARAASRDAEPETQGHAGPRMRARMESIDPKQHRRVDRRTFLKGGLLAGGALAGAGLAIKAVADATSDSRAQPSTPAPRGAAARRRAAAHVRARTSS